MKYFTFCILCGRKLSRSEDGTDSEVQCPKCGAMLSYVVKKDSVSVHHIGDLSDIKHLEKYITDFNRAN